MFEGFPHTQIDFGQLFFNFESEENNFAIFLPIGTFLGSLYVRLLTFVYSLEN